MGSNTSRQSDNQQSALQEAAFHGRIETIRLLLRNPTLDFNIALEIAFRRNHFEIVRTLMMELPSLNLTFSNNFMLRSSCTHGQSEIVRLLLERGINPAVDNNVALKSACWNGHLEVARLLLERGVDSRGIFLNTCANNHVECARLLIQHGAIQHGAIQHGADEFSEAFQFACEFGQIQIVRLLLDVERSNDRLLMDQAVLMACKRGHTDVVITLLERFGSRDVDTIKHALWIAIYKGHAVIVGELLKFLPLEVDNELNVYRTLATGVGFRIIYARLLAHRALKPKPKPKRALRDIAAQLLKYQEGILNLPIQCDDITFATMFQSQMREKCERESVRIDCLLEQNADGQESEDTIVAIEKEIADLEFMTLKPQLNSLNIAASKGFINSFRQKFDAVELNDVLHVAVSSGQTEIVRECLPFIRTVKPHFICACMLGHIDIVRLLFPKSITEREARMGEVLTIQTLDRLEPDPQDIEPRALTAESCEIVREALDVACQYNQIEVIRFLLSLP